MPKPISWREMVRRLRQCGYDGPSSGGSHPLMRRGEETIHIPNPHGKDIDWTLMKRILKQAKIDPKEWDNLA
ncbi:MAG: type II toxin-antitoxin system HicA family toxin [Verrucomicrobiaceae bacterium]|nr:type II toxin-antitoxin system HicA family toxin [Verrucomicrobiaceae bacterium]